MLLQAGNVTSGATDPFARIIPGVRERGGWVHVDGAFGLWAAASPTLRAPQVEGVELADSWATDAHKWLNAPYDSGVVIVREQRGPLPRHGHARALPRDRRTRGRCMHLSPHMSQRARGVETWALLAARGRQESPGSWTTRATDGRPFADLLARGRRRGAGASPSSTRFPWHSDRAPGDAGDDEMTDAVIAAIQAEGTLWAGGSMWKGRRILRISVSDAATTPDDVTAAALAIVACWESVLASDTSASRGADPAAPATCRP